jgi:hypothetical protein
MRYLSGAVFATFLVQSVQVPTTILETLPPQLEVVAPEAQAQAANGQQSEITNARIVEMSRLALDDDIIIARLRMGVANLS